MIAAYWHAPLAGREKAPTKHGAVPVRNGGEICEEQSLMKCTNGQQSGAPDDLVHQPASGAPGMFSRYLVRCRIPIWSLPCLLGADTPHTAQGAAHALQQTQIQLATYALSSGIRCVRIRVYE